MIASKNDLKNLVINLTIYSFCGTYNMYDPN